jgi:asparagine synthase (glutamine-hydrolysing)
MCGISGVYNYLSKPIQTKTIIEKILKLQTKRGPDSTGIWESNCKKVSFGHNRLSIIDLSNRASQPFVSTDKEYTTTFNGEIYNYKELKKELLKNNIKFRSNSDTEVILESYKYWGIEFVNKLRGMFAIAIWDNIKKELILVRDPFGIKPLYFSKKNNILFFASQVKSILSIKDVSFKKLGKSVLDYYLWGNVQEPFTLYKDIYSVDRGTVKIFDRNCNETNFVFANLKETIIKSEKDYFKDKLELNEKLNHIIKKTVNYHQVSDVPVTFLLSSGIDSNVLLAASKKEQNANLNALTLDFSEKLKESPLAQVGSKMNNINHIVKKLDGNKVLELILNYYKNMDMPTNDGLNNYVVSYFAKKIGSKVLISGIGGDELFSGYPSFKRIPIMKKLSKIIPKHKNLQNFLHNVVYKILLRFDQNTKYAGVLKYSRNTFDSFMLQRCVFTPEEIIELVNSDVIDEVTYDFEVQKEREINNNDFESEQLKIMYLEIKYYLCSKLLRDTDWASMANSVEMRTPFVDWFFFKELLPILKSNIKISKTNMLDSFKGNIPIELYDRKKTGFAIPYEQYFKKVSGLKNEYKNPIKDWSILNYKKYIENNI